eukprot:6117981-Amphidinium_carterae.2
MGALCRLQPRASSAFLRQIVSEQESPPWYSPKPEKESVQREELALMRYAYSKSDWNLPRSNHWLSCLWCGDSLVFRSKRTSDPRWYLSLGSRGHMCVLAWPLVMLQQGDRKGLVLDPKGEESYQVHLCVDDIEAYTIEWRGPLRQSLGSKVSTKYPVWGVPDHKPVSLLHVAARNAFWGLSKAQLGPVSKHMKVTIEPGSTLTVILERLYRHLHPESTDADVAKVLEKRASSLPRTSEVLESEVSKELLDNDGKRELSASVKGATQRKSQQSEMRERIVRLRPAIAVSDSKSKSKSASAKGSSSSGTIRAGTRAYPAAVPRPETAVDEATLLGLLPPNCRICVDGNQKRFYLTLPSSRGRSFSWAKYTYNGAAREMLQAAWADHEENCGGSAMPFTLDGW